MSEFRQITRGICDGNHALAIATLAFLPEAKELLRINRGKVFVNDAAAAFDTFASRIVQEDIAWREKEVAEEAPKVAAKVKQVIEIQKS